MSLLTTPLSTRDLDLIERARRVLQKNYDRTVGLHTMGAAVRCVNGNVYVGVNVHALHGACAEFIAAGSALSAGERDLECMVTVGGERADIILPPCGNCRQMMSLYMPDGQVILETSSGIMKMRVSDLLPLSFHFPNSPTPENSQGNIPTHWH